MAIESMETIAGIVILDTGLVREATELVRGVEDDVLAHFDPTFERQDLVDVILNSTWPE